MNYHKQEMTIMKNPWETILLQDYENHMSLDSVKQLQTLNEIMCDQINRYNATTAMILGVAGGNGLNHINPKRFKKVYGVDINPNYLKECIRRYPLLQDVFIPIQCDLQNESYIIPQAELMVANLLIEYIGYENFRRVIKRVQPIFVSCVIQVNTNESFVSDSPYLHVFDSLDKVHHQICKTELIRTMEKAAYTILYEDEKLLPNGKAFLRLDFIK